MDGPILYEMSRIGSAFYTTQGIHIIAESRIMQRDLRFMQVFDLFEGVDSMVALYSFFWWSKWVKPPTTLLATIARPSTYVFFGTVGTKTRSYSWMVLALPQFVGSSVFLILKPRVKGFNEI